MGAALARHPSGWGTRDGAALAVAALATTCFYWAGMALNDWFDLERDRERHGFRPLASGRIPPGTGLLIGAGLLAFGLALAGLAALAAGSGLVRGLLAGAAVGGAVLLYDGALKRWRQPGALAMGACRATNALLGGAVLGAAPGGWALVYALLLLVHVHGLTLVSTWEEEDAPPPDLVVAWGVTLLVPGLLAVLPVLPWGPDPTPGLGVWVGALPLGAVVLTQAVLALEQGTRARGERPTRALLRALWLLDLALVLGHGLIGLLPPLFGLWLAGTQGAKLLFAPPPRPRS